MSTKNPSAGIPAKPKFSFKKYLNDTLSEYSYLSLAVMIPAVILLIIYISRGLYPFGDGTVLVLDLNGQYVYFFEALKRTVLEGGSLLYSWSRSLGGEFLGMYAYYLASPLSYLILLFPSDKTQEFLLALIMLKAAISGGTMAFYLHKHSVNKNKLIVVAFSVLYSMCAFTLVHHSNTMWMDAVMWLPLVVHGIEQLIRYGKYKTFIIFLTLTVASNFYIGYMVCIFVFLYFFYYYIAHQDDGENNPMGEKLHFLKSFLRIAAHSVISIGMAAVIILGAYYSLQFGKNEFTDPSWNIAMRLDIFDLFFKLLPSAYDTVRIDGLPFIYCGVLTVLLVPLYFCSKKFTLKEKAASGVLIFIFTLSFMITVLDLVWHGFQKPQWLNNRYSFMLCFFLVFLAFRAFEHWEEISMKAIAAVAGFVALFVVMLQNFDSLYVKKLEELSYGPQDGDFEVHAFATVLLTIACLLIYIAIASAMKKAKNKDSVAAVLLAVIVIEVFLSGASNVNDFGEDVGFSSYKRYNSFKAVDTAIADAIDDTDPSFYRAEMTLRRKDNENFYTGFKGVTSTTSTLNKDTIAFLHNMGYYGASHRSRYQGGNPVGDSLVGIKYIVSQRDYSVIYGDPVLTAKDYAKASGMTLEELEEITLSNNKYEDYTVSDLNVYENPYALSLAFGASSDIFDVNFLDQNLDKWVDEDDERYNPEGYASPFERLNALYTAILGEDETVEIFKPAVQNGQPTLSQGVSVNSEGHQESSGHYKYTGEKGDRITYSYTVKEGVMLYLYFPAFYSRQIKISSPTLPIFDATAEALEKDNYTLSNCNERIVELGYTTGTDYTLNVTIDNSSGLFYTKIADCYIYYLDEELLASVTERIKQEQFIIKNDYRDDFISGTIHTSTNNRTILTTIPYDEGWRVFVDGKPVEIKEAANALIAFEIDNAGDHELTFVYASTPVIIGTVISVGSVALFIALIVIDHTLKKTKFVSSVLYVKDPETDTEAQKK